MHRFSDQKVDRITQTSAIGCHVLRKSQWDVDMRDDERMLLERSNAASRFDADAGSPDCLGTVRPLGWSELWIPFFRRNKEPACIDLDPAPGVEAGQIIEIDWEGRCNRVLTPNLDAFLAGIADSSA
jgi:cell wall assembly regulator SMI1